MKRLVLLICVRFIYCRSVSTIFPTFAAIGAGRVAGGGNRTAACRSARADANQLTQTMILYTLTGTVVAGNRIGRQWGFPTANIPVAADADLRDGVYVATVTVEGQTFGAMVNVGSRPTVVEAGARLAEAHLFGFTGDLYGRSIAIALRHYLRPERRFESPEALRRQIDEDRRQALAYLAAEGDTLHA